MRAAVLHNLRPPAVDTPAAGRPGNLLFSCLLLVLALFLAWMCRAFGPPFVKEWFRPLPFESSFDLLLLLAAVWAAMLVHEAGHLSAALLLGFRVSGAMLGPFQIQGLHGNWKVSFVPANFFSASVSAVPRNMDHWRRLMLIVVAAGPLATAAGVLLAATAIPASQAQVFFHVTFIQVSLLIFSLGLVPNPVSSRTPNDARLLWNLTAKNAGAEELELTLRLTHLVIEGVRPQDYPLDLLLRLAAWKRRPESEAVFAQAMSRWALDSGHAELAAAWDLRALEVSKNCNARLRNTALASSACLDVVLRDDLESARIKFSLVDFRRLFPSHFVNRARAAQEVAEGRPYRASPLIIRSQYALPKGIPSYELDRSILASLHMLVLESSARTIQRKVQSASA